MAITRALEFDQTPNRMLFEIGEQARQQQLMQQKLQQENQEKIFQVYQGVGPAALYPKYNKLVVNQRLGGLQKKLSDYQKQNPNANYLNLQSVANQEVGEIAQQSAGIEAMESDIDKWISSMDQKSPYDKSRLRALARNEAFYEEDGRTLRSNFDGLKVDDIISSVIQKYEDKVIDPFKGEQAMNDVVKDASLYTKNVEQTVETPDGRKTVVVGQKSSVPFFLEAKDGELRVKEQPNGYIDEGVFQQFYQNPAIRANVNANAKSNMKKIGVPDSPEANEYFKRAYLTTWLEGNKKGVIDMVDKTLYQKPTAPSGSGAAPADQTYINAYQKIDALTSSKKKGFGTPFNELDLETQDVVLKMVKPALGGVSVGQADIYLKKEADGTNAVYTSKALMDDDGNVVRKANDRIGALTTTGVNLAANKGGGVKAKKAIMQQKSSKYVVGGKEYSMDDLKGMGYTEDQVNQAIKAGTVKLK
jgi:hypothetical protein